MPNTTVLVGIPNANPTNPPAIDPIRPKTAAFQEFTPIASRKMTPTSGEPMKNTCPTPFKMKLIIVVTKSIKKSPILAEGKELLKGFAFL
jgi:hypothetical protein